MVGRQAKRHEGKGGHIERTIVGVPVCHVLLACSTETDGEIALLIEVVLLVEHTMEHLGQGCTHLTVAQVARQLLIPSHQCEWLHSSHTIRDASSESREGTLRRDETLQDEAILLATLQLTVVILLVVETSVSLGIYHRLQGLQVHRMEHITAIVVEGKDRTIGIPAITHIPLFHLATSRVDTILVVVATCLRHETLDGRREKQPVGIWRVDMAEFGKLGEVAFLGHLIQWHPQGVISTEETLGDISSIHQVLSTDTPTEIVRTLRVNGIFIGSQSPLTQLLALLALGSIFIRQGKPRSHASHQSSEALHVEYLLVAVVEARTELRLHVLLQLALRHVFQHGLSHLVSQGAPIFTVALLLYLLLGTYSHERNQRQKDGHHDSFIYIIHR